jgi:hypothetical protein
MQRIADKENILRTMYRWTGPFCVTYRHKIRETKIQTDKDLAYLRIPANLLHQRHLLSDWFLHFRNCCNGAMQDARSARRFTEDNMYNVMFVETIVAPALVEEWNLIRNTTKDQLHRCFQNLGILGQLYIRDIGVMLPQQQVNVNAFVTDNQNVHRSDTVKYVTDIYAKLLKIAVPPEQNTLAEIILHCKLPPKAIVQLTQHYCTPVSIYEIPDAYPKALDGVWSYVRSHPEKSELYMRVKDELTDNIGMCAQGNLSRLCNILSGYLDGVAPPVAKGELIQQKISAIAMDETSSKVERGRAVLRELDVPEDEWEPWIAALEGL